MKTYLEEDGTVTIATECLEAAQWYRNQAAQHPYNYQIGGDHYAKYAIQPLEYIIKNKLNFVEGCVVKYVTRWRDKGGVEDLKKAKHYLEMLIEESK